MRCEIRRTDSSINQSSALKISAQFLMSVEVYTEKAEQALHRVTHYNPAKIALRVLLSQEENMFDLNVSGLLIDN